VHYGIFDAKGHMRSALHVVRHWCAKSCCPDGVHWGLLEGKAAGHSLAGVRAWALSFPDTQEVTDSIQYRPSGISTLRLYQAAFAPMAPML
jgi:hypothetical protein